MAKQTESWMRCESCGATCPDNGVHDECLSCRRRAREERDEIMADRLHDEAKERRMEEKYNERKG